MHQKGLFLLSKPHQLSMLTLGYNPPPITNCPQHRWQSSPNSINIPKLKGKKPTKTQKPKGFAISAYFNGKWVKLTTPFCKPSSTWPVPLTLSTETRLRQELTRGLSQTDLFLTVCIFILMAVIQRHQLLIISLNPRMGSMWTPQPNIQSRSQTGELFICTCKDPSEQQPFCYHAIMHNWFAGKSLHVSAQAIQHQYTFTKPQVCSQSPLRTLSKIPPVSSSPYSRAVYRPQQDFTWSKCSETPWWFSNVMYNGIPFLSPADGRNTALSKHTISNRSAMPC